MSNSVHTALYLAQPRVARREQACSTLGKGGSTSSSKLNFGLFGLVLETELGVHDA